MAITTVGDLIQAIHDANYTGQGTIELAAGGLYTLTEVNNIQYEYDPPHVVHPNGLPSITGEITINGNGAVIERQNNAPYFRIFYVASGGSLTLNELTVRGSYMEGFKGGAIYNSGALALNKATVSNNSAFYGGGIYNDGGTVSISESTITNNSTVRSGGGILNDGGTMSISESIITNNSSSEWGGGIRSGRTWDTWPEIPFRAGNVFVSKSIISNNSIIPSEYDQGGGGISCFRGTLTIVDSVISNNQVPFDRIAGGIAAFLSDLTITGSQVIGNSAGYVAGIEAGGTRDEGPIQIKIEYCEIAYNSTTGQSGEALRFQSGSDQQVSIHYCSIHDNPLISVSSGTPSPLVDATYNWWGALDGPSGEGPGSGDAITTNIDYMPFLTSDTSTGMKESNHEGPCSCECGIHECADGLSSSNPVSLHYGEKRFEATDLSLNTPAGLLAFTRTYRQSKQNDYKVMGRGWAHNHLLKLTKITGSPNILMVQMPTGGVARFTEISANHYEADPGASSFVDWDDTANHYILTTLDGSRFVFDSDGKLASRSWANGETWTYHYDGSGKLIQVVDVYGDKLVFRYYPSGDYDGLLRWVGDQTFDETDPQNLKGRYVEFHYTRSKVVNSNGVIVDAPNSEDSLLTSVFDLLGQEWKYSYYAETGQDADVRQLNFLIKRESPLVDTDGDRTPDSYLTLEETSYTMQGTQMAVNGGMEQDSDWSNVGTPTTNERSSAQVDEGSYSRHVVCNDANEGIEGNEWSLVKNLTYIVTARVYPVSGVVRMQVSGQPTLYRITGGTGAWETLRVIHQATDSVSSVTLQFFAEGGGAEFYVDAVSIIETDQRVSQIDQQRGNAALNTSFVFQAGGADLTTETVAGKPTTHRFSGVYLGAEDPKGNFNSRILNSQYRPITQQDANGNQTLLDWSEGGKHLHQVIDALGAKTAFSYDEADRLGGSTDAEGRETTYIYDADSRQPTLILAGVTRQEIDINGSMEQDGGWSGVNSPLVNERLATKVDSGDYSRYVVADAADEGIESDVWDLVANQNYTITARVYPVSGVVKMQVPGITPAGGDKPSSTGTGAWETLTITHSPTTSATDKRLQFLADGGAAEFYVDTINITTNGEIDVNGGMELDSGWSNVGTPTTNARATAQAHSGSYSRHVVTDAADEGIASEARNFVARQVYSLTAQVYPVSGVGSATVKMRLVDETETEIPGTILISRATDTWECLTVTYMPLLDMNNIKLQFLAEGGAAEFYVDSVSITLARNVADPLIGDINGDMERIGGWQNVNTPTRNERHVRVDTGVYYRQVRANTGAGIESNAWTLEVHRTYTITARIYLNSSTKIKMTVTGGTGFDTLSTDETGQWRTLRVTHTVAAGEEGNQRLQFLADGDGANFYVDNVTIRIAPEIDLNGGMELDSGWTGVNSPTTNERANTHVDSGDHARYVMTDAVDEGIESGTWDLEAGQNYVIQARVYPMSGVVKMQVPGVTPAAEDKWTTESTGAWETLTITHTPPVRVGGRTLQFLSSGGAATFYVDSVSVTTTGEIDVRGDMETADPNSGWSNVLSPSTHERSGVQKDSGAYSRHVVTDTADEGMESTAWNLIAHQTYAIRARVFVVSGVGSETVKMRLVDASAQEIPDTSATSKYLDEWESLSCEYTPSVDASSVNLQFVASGGLAEFYVDSVSIRLSHELPIKGDMETADPNSGWADVLSPLTNARCARVDSGTYFQRVIAGNGAGIESVAFSLTENHTYLLMARVYLITTPAVKMTITGGTDFDVVSSMQNGLWQTLRAVHEVTTGEAGSQTLQFLAQDNGAEFYADTVHLVDLGEITGDIEDQVRWQEFAYDTKGRPLAERVISPANAHVIQETTRTYYASGMGSGLLKQVVQVDSDGLDDRTTTYSYDSTRHMVKTQQNTTFGNCTASYTVYDAMGNVLASICNYDPGTKAAPTTAEEAAALYDATSPDKNRVTAYRYDTVGRRVETTASAGSLFERTNLTFYDALGRVWRTIENYQPQGSSAPGDWVWTNDRWEYSPNNPVSHGSDNTQNAIADTQYNALGLVRLRQDTLGKVTLYGYDDAGRLVKTVQNAATPDHNNDFIGSDPNEADPSLSAYPYSPHVLSTAPDEDIITEQVYDAASNLVKTIDPLGKMTVMIYDALNRPFKTLRNPNDPDYDFAGDPNLSGYSLNADPDTDLLETTDYDNMGRVIRTQRLLDNRPTAQWETTLFGYDTLDRQVKVIRSASNPTYNVAADPDLSGYVASNNPDQDIVTRTVYDSSGRVLYTENYPEDALLGVKTRLVYDGLGRQIRTVANFQGTGYGLPEQWRWEDGVWKDGPGGTTISHGDNNDENIITETVYDSDGRVQSTRDVLGRASRNVYDSAARVIRTITNFVPQYDGQDEAKPEDWYWDDTAKQWKSEVQHLPDPPTIITIDHGTDNDENIVADTEYDAQGRVSKTFDHRYNQTLYFYDTLGRRVKTVTNYLSQFSSDPANWVWNNNEWQDGSNHAIAFGSDNDQNRISTTTYDLVGWVTTTRDAAGNESRYTYDALGRRTQTIENYENGVYDAGTPDRDILSTTAYNKGGQVVSTMDARGTSTASTYDQVGRRLTVAQAANTSLASVSYTCYDKAGKVLRTIANWTDDPSSPSPDAQDGNGNWLFAPVYHGTDNDRDLVTAYEYDLAGRRTNITDPQGSFATTAYFKDGQVQGATDPENAVSQYRYDGLRRRTRVVQGYTPQGDPVVDPADWVWNPNATPPRWEYGMNYAVQHGSDNDQNIIVLVAYDTAGRMISQFDPLSHETLFEYDQLNRRKSLTNPLTNIWQTTYADLTTGGTQTVLADPNGINTTRSFDRLGRLLSVTYDNPANTSDVKMAYDTKGNRAVMSEYSGLNFTSRVRETQYSYDARHRVTSIGFDNEGNGSVDQTVSYQYDAAGQRTRLTMPDDLNITYVYDARGRLVSLADWDGHVSQFGYDAVGRPVAAIRPNGLSSRYDYDSAGRLRQIRHHEQNKVLARFLYDVDKRGNRTRAIEQLAHDASVVSTIGISDPAVSYYRGTWSTASGFKVTPDWWAAMTVAFTGQEAAITLGTGSDHGIFDIYVDGSLWESFDGYAATAGERVIHLYLDTGGAHIVDIRNRHEQNRSSSGCKLRFKQLAVLSTTYAAQTIFYAYDRLSRLLSADYTGVTPTRNYTYAYDLAGNRTLEDVTIGTTETTTDYNYNPANQIWRSRVNQGTWDDSYTYDANGNLTSDGVNTYTWDRANRLTSMGGLSYAYDGAGNRISQRYGVDVTKYLLDLQPGLPLVIARTTNGNTDRFIHLPGRGIFAQEDHAGVWQDVALDGLNSARLVVDDTAQVVSYQSYTPIGVPLEDEFGSPFTFTGELLDANALLYLRARYYTPALGVFTGLDLVENGNRYQYVSGNIVNRVDPSGMIISPREWDSCYQQTDNCVDAPGHQMCLTGCMEGFRALDDPNDLYKFPRIVQNCYNACMRIQPKCYYSLPCGREGYIHSLYPSATISVATWPGQEIGAVLIWRCESRRWEVLTHAVTQIFPEREELHYNDHFITLQPYDPETVGYSTEYAAYLCFEGSRRDLTSETRTCRAQSFVLHSLFEMRWDEHGAEESGPCPDADIWTAVSIGLGGLGVAGININSIQNCIFGFGSALEQLGHAIFGTGPSDHLFEDLGIAIVDCGLNVTVGGRVLGAAEIANAIRTACFR